MLCVDVDDNDEGGHDMMHTTLHYYGILNALFLFACHGLTPPQIIIIHLLLLTFTSAFVAFLLIIDMGKSGSVVCDGIAR